MKIDTVIYEKLKARDEAGLTLLYDNYLDALYGMSFRILRNESHAEDAVQKAFLKIWNNIDQYDPNKSTLFTWMARIVKNSAIDTSRLVSFQNESKSESLDTNVHNVRSEELNLSQIDTDNFLEVLDEKYAVVIDYLYLRGYSQTEVSKLLDIPLGTIKTRVKKGISILKEYFKGDIKLLSLVVCLMNAIFV